MARVLAVDDERDLLGTLSIALRRDGHEVVVAECLAQAKDSVAAQVPDLIVLDWMLPDGSGARWCRSLRSVASTAGVAVILLTARGDEESRVEGLEAGADDYVVKPFSVRELCLRVRALCRRAAREDGAPERWSLGPLTMDVAAHDVCVEGSSVLLTVLEFRLLHTLLSRRGRVQSREVLLADVWGLSPDLNTRTVDTHIKRLRQKLGAAGRLVETLRGVGYRVRDEGAALLD